MEYTISKYRPLARSHRCEPEDSAVAAFEAMRTRAVRRATDPWAVVTRAVQVSLIAEERANGLLCSPGQARRACLEARHDARRFSDYESDVLEFHPAFRDTTSTHGLTIDPRGRNGVAAEEQTGAFEACDLAAALFTALGWPADTAASAIEYVAARLIESGSRPAAHAMLRRDHSARALLDLDRRSWATLLRLLIGNPNPDVAYTSAGHGILVRLLIGESVSELLEDDALVAEVARCAPRGLRSGQSGWSDPAGSSSDG